MKDKQIKYGMILSYIYVVLNVISGLCFTPYLIKTLGKSQYGLYEIIVSLASNMSILNFGMSDCIVKFVSTYRNQNNKNKQGEVIGNVLKILLISSTIATFICICVYLKFDTIYAKSLTKEECIIGKQLLILSSIDIITSLPGSIFSSTLIAYEKFAITRGLNIIKIISRIFLILVFLNFSASAMTILIIDTILNLVIIIVCYIFMKNWLNLPIIMKNTDKDLCKRILSFSGYTVFFIIAKEIQWQTDKTIIGIRLNTIMVTIYAAGSKVSAIFNQLGYTLSGMFLPKAIQLNESCASKEDYKNYMVFIARLILPLLLGVMIAYAFMGKTFMVLWMGTGYEESFYSSFIMMFAVLIPMLEDTGLAILKARDKQKEIAITWFISSITNIFLTWITVKEYGIVAASVTTFATSYLINVLTLNIILKKEVGLEIFSLFKEMFKGTIPLILIGIIFFLLIDKAGFKIDSWFTFIITGILFAIVYILSIYIFFLSNYQKKILSKNIKQITQKRMK